MCSSLLSNFIEKIEWLNTLRMLDRNSLQLRDSKKTNSQGFFIIIFVPLMEFFSYKYISQNYLFFFLSFRSLFPSASLIRSSFPRSLLIIVLH